MKVFLHRTAGGIVIQARAENDGGTIIGDATWTIEPGRSFLGHTYVELLALDEGEHSLRPKRRHIAEGL